MLYVMFTNIVDSFYEEVKRLSIEAKVMKTKIDRKRRNERYRQKTKAQSAKESINYYKSHRDSILEIKHAKYKINTDSIRLQQKRSMKIKLIPSAKRKGFNIITRQSLSVRREKLILKSTLLIFPTKGRITAKSM